MAAILVQQTTAQFGATLPGDIVLGATPTPGNLLVLTGWGRGGLPSVPTGFTTAGTATGVIDGRPLLVMAYRVVQAGDSATWATAIAGSRRYSLVEWSRLGPPDDVITAILGAGTYTTGVGAIVANPAGAAHAIAVFGSGTDVPGREIHVASPTTLIHEGWAEGTVGTYGSVGYANGQCVATALNSAFQDVGYVAAHFVSTAWADFEGITLTGAAPRLVAFRDRSTRIATSWLWDFGDGGTSTLQHPVHTYVTNGTFTVTLTATDATGSDTEIKAAYVSAASGSAPRGLSGAPEYVIELYDSSATFGPNNKLAEIWDARNVGWARYDRMPGKAFFTLAQGSVNQTLLVKLLTHIAIWRITPSGDTLVYRGAYIDSNDTGDDVVNDCYDYLSLLSLSRSGFKTLYPTKLLGTEIVSPEWLLAKNAGSSPLGFITTGTIQDPLATDGVTAIKTNAQFGTLDQTRLQLFFDLTEMGRANTVNHVTFEIDLTNTFNFWKNRGTASEFALVLGGNVSEYTFLPGWTRYRNDLATVGVGGTGGAAELVSTNAGEIAAKGLRQDVTTLKTLAGISTGVTETDQQKAALDRQLKSLVQQSSALMLRVERGKVEPFVGYDLNDTAHIEIGNGIDLITGRRRIVGVRCLFAEAGEDIDLMVSPVVT